VGLSKEEENGRERFDSLSQRLAGYWKREGTKATQRTILAIAFE
jgi:hypothetical protein